MELHAREGRAVLVGGAGEHAREVEPDRLPLPENLTTALQEWAQVTDAIIRAGKRTGGDTTGELVSRRGAQLAARLAGVLGTEIDYVDPFLGRTTAIDPVALRPEPEPTPWGTGIAVSAFVAVVVLCAVVSVTIGLGETSVWLALGANLVIGGGLAPSVWLTRGVPVWRWVAYGVVVGLGLAWFGLILGALG